MLHAVLDTEFGPPTGEDVDGSVEGCEAPKLDELGAHLDRAVELDRIAQIGVEADDDTVKRATVHEPHEVGAICLHPHLEVVNSFLQQPLLRPDISHDRFLSVEVRKLYYINI